MVKQTAFRKAITYKSHGQRAALKLELRSLSTASCVVFEKSMKREQDVRAVFFKNQRKIAHILLLWKKIIISRSPSFVAMFLECRFRQVNG